MNKGLIVKGIAGFYYVLKENQIYECKARGLFRKDNQKPLIGDYVEFEITDEVHFKGYINEIKKRKNELIRPSVSNVDQALIIFSIKNPTPDFYMLDKLLMIIKNSNVNPIICLNKIDLENDSIIYNKIKEEYTNAGYEVFLISAKGNVGLDEVMEILKDKITVLAGPSGVGKSTLVNSLLGKELMETGFLSEKISRGKHTTRHSEILFGDNHVRILDTPGFTSYDIKEILYDEVMYLFNELEDNLGRCQFQDCLHIKEPNCHIKDMVEQGTISRRRYESYIKIVEEIRNERKK
jgi:ribosome biogenesis GTPase